MIEILVRVIEVEARKRWRAKKCLARGFDNGLFKRGEVDGLVVCTSDPDVHLLPTEGGDDGSKTPPAASPSAGALLRQPQAEHRPLSYRHAENMWGGP